MYLGIVNILRLKHDVVLMKSIQLVCQLSLPLVVYFILETLFTLVLSVVLLEHRLALIHHSVILHIFHKTPSKLFAFIDKAGQVLSLLLTLLKGL